MRRAATRFLNERVSLSAIAAEPALRGTGVDKLPGRRHPFFDRGRGSGALLQAAGVDERLDLADVVPALLRVAREAGGEVEAAEARAGGAQLRADLAQVGVGAVGIQVADIRGEGLGRRPVRGDLVARARVAAARHDAAAGVVAPHAEEIVAEAREAGHAPAALEGGL